MNNKLKTILIFLIVILLSAISFGGIYVKNLNDYTNVINNYKLSRNLKGSRVVELKAELNEQDGITTESETEENIVKDKTVEETGLKEELKLAKRILEKRLKDLGSEDYVIEQNAENGDTTIYLSEDELTDNITAYLQDVGEFKIVDADDENNILMTNEDLKVVKVGYATETTGTTVYLSIEFNKEGKKKLEDISNKYTTVEVEEDTNQTENELSSEEVTSGNEEESEDTAKQVKLMIDDTEIMTTAFDETVSNGILQMSIGSAATNVADIQTYITQANGIAVILNNGKMPIEYTIESNEYVSADMTKNIQIAVSVLTGIALVACLILVIRFKANGLKAAISFIGMIAIFLLLVRYTNVYIAMESIIAFIILIVVNTYFNWIVLKNYKEKAIMPSIISAYKKSAKITIPILVIAVALCFINWTPIASIGMLLFWGLISMIIASFTITLPILNNKK